MVRGERGEMEAHLVDPHSVFKQKRALVIGDFMVDIYTRGEAGRISPEAPVLILQVTDETQAPGGAGNAILNMISLGMTVKAIGRIGSDIEGKELIEMFQKEGVETSGIVTDTSFRTPVKRRLIADNQQLLRVDHEKTQALSYQLEEHIEAHILKSLDGVDVVAISDYGKGFLTPRLLTSTIKNARLRGIPIIVDPKGRDFSRYRGATLIKPNLQEAIVASGLDKSASLSQIAEKLLQETEIEMLMVTRSKEGISIFYREGHQLDFPAKIREVRDVTGAGDTVFAIIAQTLANDIDLNLGALFANVAAGIAIERFGCARVTLSELKERLFDLRLLLT